MENINKGMEDFFQECGFMGHVIIIVLPNFFKLHEDYAVARSIFLIDAFADKDFNRGYFNFYNEKQKESLYYFGKKRIGVSAKYRATNENFWGKFSSWLPFDKDKYERMKKEAIEKKRMSRTDKRMALQRDALIWVLKKKYGASYNTILKILKDACGVELDDTHIRNIVSFVDEKMLNQLEIVAT